MQFRSILWLAIAVLQLLGIHGYRILVYCPQNGRSQVTYLGRLADILVDAGHDVTVLLVQHNPDVSINGTEKAKVVRIPGDEKVAAHFKNDDYIADTWTMNAASPLGQRRFVLDYAQTLVDQCAYTVKQTELLKELNNMKFDLMLHELFDHCQLGLMQMLGIEKHIAMQSTVLFEAVGDAIGIPYAPSITPAVFATAGNNMTFFEKIGNLIQVAIGKEFIGTISAGEEEIFERVLRNKFNSFQNTIDTASYIVTNSDPLLDFPHNSNSRVVELGGVAVKQPKELDAEWKQILESRDAAILISFGSVAKSVTMPAEIKNAFVELFKQFPQFAFIWKYESEETDFLRGLSNVHTSKWLPQNDVLNHPNLKLFISHGGMNSMLEAAHRGVPVLVIPLFADQMRNAKMAENVGIGLEFDRFDLKNSVKLTDAVRKVLMETKYKNTAKRVASMIAYRPVNLTETFVRHVEFAAKYGPVPNMVSLAPRTSFISYYLIDIAFALLGFVILFPLILCCVLRKTVKYICARRREKMKWKIV